MHLEMSITLIKMYQLSPIAKKFAREVITKKVTLLLYYYHSSCSTWDNLVTLPIVAGKVDENLIKLGYFENSLWM